MQRREGGVMPQVLDFQTRAIHSAAEDRLPVWLCALIVAAASAASYWLIYQAFRAVSG